jgi:P27 family predicted phage terminase small subunit
MRGIKPLPTAIKELRGTLEKSRVLSNEMTVTINNEIPQAPEDLNAEGKKLWNEVCHELKNNNLLANVDLGLVEAYCNELAQYKEAVRQIKKTSPLIKSPSGYAMVSPWQTIRRQSLKAAMDLGQLFGVTPSARTRIGSNTPKASSKLELLQKSKIA